MSLPEVERYLFDLKNDPSLQEQLRSDNAKALKSYDLTESERSALRAGDLEWLWLAGVHPLLLTPFSRFLGLPPGDYRARLSKLEGFRTITSTAATALSGEDDPL